MMECLGFALQQDDDPPPDGAGGGGSGGAKALAPQRFVAVAGDAETTAMRELLEWDRAAVGTHK
jgi:hypothetical protein